MPKLLWVSPLSVHDTANASATQWRNMLLSLKAREVDIVGLSALNFVQESGTAMFTDLDEKLKGNENSFNLNDNNINFIYMRTKSRHLGEMTSQEQRNFYAKFCAIINAFRPDVVMGCGTDMLSMVCFDEAKRRGLPTVYTLLDATPRRFNFPNIDVVVTDSAATSNLYATLQKINCVVLGSFLPVVGVPRAQREDGSVVEPHRITMINPSLDKGVALFTKLATMAPAVAQELKFTVYETYQGQFAEQIAQAHDLGATDPAFSAEALQCIEVLPPTTPSREVLAETKVLIAPSLSFEGINALTREAVVSGIPVLATNQIGLAESIGEAGVLLEIPAYCLNDHHVVPRGEDMANFVKGLTMLLSEDYSARCAKVSRRFDVNLSANRLAVVLKPLFDQRAGNNPQLLRNGSLV